jgi:hypothetical protein
MVNKESKVCPILRAAGYVNGKELCNEKCALYVEKGCSLAVFAKAKAEEVKDALP